MAGSAEADCLVEPRRRARRLTGPQIEEIVSEYRKGATTRELAARDSIHRTTASQRRAANGVSARSNVRKLTDGDVPAIAARYAAGESTATIAAEYQVDPMTISRELRRAGYGLRPWRGW